MNSICTAAALSQVGGLQQGFWGGDAGHRWVLQPRGRRELLRYPAQVGPCRGTRGGARAAQRKPVPKAAAAATALRRPLVCCPHVTAARRAAP
jgi:hypothetical protein